jgi:hypothetical protein
LRGATRIAIESIDNLGLASPNYLTTTINVAGGGTASFEGIDFDHRNSVSAQAIVSAGYSFVINYLGPAADGYLTSTTARSYIDAGLNVVSVYEVTQRRDPITGNWIDYDPRIVGDSTYIQNDLGYANGYLDGTNAYNYATGISRSSGSAIYFAVDGDATGTNINNVIQYFQGIQNAFNDLSGTHPQFSVGVYGSGYVLDTIFNDNLASFRWLADAPGWSGSLGYTNYDMRQHDNRDKTTFPGEEVDHDTVRNQTNFSQWGATQPLHVRARNDFNNDGRSDIVWRNSSGLFTEWQSTGSSFTPNVYANGNVDPSWQMVGLADFNNDGDSDILWRNTKQRGVYRVALDRQQLHAECVRERDGRHDLARRRSCRFQS